MSFSRSKRFNENKATTPGPGHYENEWGTIGTESIKYKIHATPRFLERCKKIGKKGRLCIECTCVDIVTKKPSDEFLLKVQPSCAVQNITFRGRNPSGKELRKILCNLILFRKTTCDENHSGTSFVNDKKYQGVDLSSNDFWDNIGQDQYFVFSKSSDGEDSGFSSPSRSFRFEYETTACSNKDQSTNAYDTKVSDTYKITQDQYKNRSLQILSDSRVHKTSTPMNKRTKTSKKLRFSEDFKTPEQQSPNKNKENSKCFLANQENDQNMDNSSRLHTNHNLKGPDNLMEILENILNCESHLTQRVSDTNLRQTFIIKSLQFLEKKLMDQRKETENILSLISILEKEAILLSSEEKSIGKKIFHLRY